MFYEHRSHVEDEQRSRLPLATRTGDNIARVRELFRSDRKLTVRMISDEVNMNRETVHFILYAELGMRKICAQMVPRNLTEQQRDAWLSAVFDIQMHYDDTAASLLTWPLTLPILFISKNKIGSKRTQF
jgi:AraC-like DNA-binding protein